MIINLMIGVALFSVGIITSDFKRAWIAQFSAACFIAALSFMLYFTFNFIDLIITCLEKYAGS